MTGEGGIRIGWNELYSFPLTDSVTGEITGVIEFVRDVTERRNMEEALLRSEDKFSTAFHKSPTIMSISEVDDGLLIDVNDKFCEVFGFSRDECIGKTSVDLGLLSAEVRMLLHEKLLANGSISGAELKLLTKDKKEIYCVYNVDLIQTKTRQLLLAVAQDITGRKRMEKELKDNEARYRRISSLTSDIAYSCQKPYAAPYFIDWMIGATERILGYAVDDIKALKCWRNIVVDEDLSIFDSNVTGVSPGTSAFCELRLRHKDGSIVWVSSYAECIQDPGSPDNLHLYGGLVDITERKIIEKALVESEKKYRLITETIKDCFWMATSNIDRMLYVSPAYETIWGRSCQSLYESPRSFMDAMHPDDRNRAVNILEEHRSRMAECDITYRIIRPDGAIRWIEDRSFTVLDENGNLYMNVGVASDITVRKSMEDELRQSETKLRLIAETIEDLVWICPPDYSKIIYLSPSYEKLWGRTRQSAYDQPLSFIESIHPEDRDRVRALLQEHGSEHRDHEYRIVRPDGTVRWIHDRAFPVRDKAGNVQLMTGVSRDITDWKLAQETLRESEEKFTKVFHYAPIPMTLSNADDGTFVDANYKFCEISGFSLPECIGKTSVDVGWLLPKERTRLIREILTHGIVKDMDLKAQTRDKRELELIYCGELLQTGEHQLLLSTAMDVTERKQLEAKNLLLAAIVDSSDDAIIGKTPDGIITSWNKGAEKLYGYPEHEVIGKPITILAPHGRGDEIRGILEQIRNGKSVNRIETVRQNRAGEIIPISLTVSPIIDKDGTIIGASTITRDISDRVKGEEQRDLLQKQLYQAQKMEAVGTLAGGIAHDFNNILQVVRGFSDIGLLDSSASDTNRDRFRKINEAAQKAADLVRGLMMFSRKSEYNPQPLDMNQHITNVRNMLERTIPKDITIELMLEEKLPVIDADPTGVDQVLMNLAVNARDAMPYGGNLTFKTANVTLDHPVTAEHVHVKPGHYVLLTVSDTGVGMDRATMEHIFEPFFTTKMVGKGTGLGLAVIHGIVNQHQGHIRCESEPGKGTRFEIYFPIPEFGRKSIELAHEEEPTSSGTETILVVDDEEIVREFMVSMLSNAGYKVSQACNGQEALEIYQSRQNEIDLVLLDLMMPVMGGQECLERLLKINESAKVVIASGFMADGPISDTTTAGAKGSISKPFSRKEALKEIRKVLDSE